MKIRELIRLDHDNSPANTRNNNIPRQRIATNGQPLDRIAPALKPALLQDTPADAGPIDSVQTNLAPAPSPSLTDLASIPTAHRRDLDLIKQLLAQLPTPTDQ
jgi:hypothetical protein